MDRHVPGLTDEAWRDIKRRYDAWWHGDLHDRPLIQVTAPRDGAPPPEPWKGGTATPAEMWSDIDYAIWMTGQRLERTWYGGEALPTLESYLSPIGMSAGGGILFGCTPRFAADTVWVDPLPAADGFPQLAVDPARRRWIRDAFAAAGRASRGRFYGRESFANHAGDTLAAIRGTEQMLVDLIENPGWVAQAVERITDITQEFLRELWPLVSPEVLGLEGWVSTAGMWSAEMNFCADCDVSCMVSPRQFEGIFLPPLRRAMRDFSHTLYHLDGTEALRHLDALLATPEVDGIQWVPGAGREDLLQWVPVVRRIQAAGKCVQVLARPAEIEPFLREVSPKGLLFSTGCASEAEGRALVERVSRLSGVRPS
jgi:hypothetical protein